MRAALCTFAATIGLAAAAHSQIGAHPTRDGTKAPARPSATAKPSASVPAGVPIGLAALVGGSDDCASAESIVPGTVAFDTSLATMGAQGQSEAACNFSGNTAIARDVWFRFVAPASGVANVTTCATTTLDSKIAAYAGAGCPTASALACSDDACALQSTIAFSVTAGASYVLQVGVYPGAAGGPGNLTLGIVPAAPNDECAAATSIAGTGPHAFDNTQASAGTQGQSEAACFALGSTNLARDVWFTWTAAQTGFHELSLCGTTSLDTKVAVYAGAGCPSSTALACNEDRCGLQSSLCFSATSGATYTIQIGASPTANGGGSGTFVVQPTGGATNDDCVNAAPIAGFGPFAFDASSATTSCQGQSNVLCNFYGQTGIARDLWFRWTSPSTGTFEVSTCGTSGNVDTKIAVYAGAGCPAAAAVACDDDGCGTFAGEARACFAAQTGETYTFQIGSYPGAPPAVGSFAIQAAPSPAGCRYDDGGSENALGNASGGAIVWFHRFGATGQSGTITSVSAAFGTPQFPGAVPPVGTPVVACVWEDPNDDGNPTDAVLVRQVSGVVGHVDGDVLDEFAFSPPVTTTGVFFAGVSLAHAQAQFPAALDQTSCPRGSNGRAWIAAAPNGTINLANLAANAVPPAQPDALGFPGVWLVRANCTLVIGTGYCFGDGTGTACPCGNFGAPGRGCANSVDPQGGWLRATGVASVTADSATLVGSGMPLLASCLYFQGSTTASVAFGDGLRCVGGSVVRLGTKANVGGSSSFPAPGDPSISARSATYTPPQPLSAGATRYYQGWYRNSSGYCTPATFNLTNGVTLVWGP